MKGEAGTVLVGKHLSTANAPTVTVASVEAVGRKSMETVSAARKLVRGAVKIKSAGCARSVIQI